MPKVTFHLTPVVEVRVIGERDGSGRMPDDGGLVERLLEWMRGQNIYPAVRGGQVGGGTYIYDHRAEDAERIRLWLIENGAVEQTYGQGLSE